MIRVKLSYTENGMITLRNPRHQSNPIIRLTLNFSLDIIDFTDKLIEKKRFRLADQLFGSASSIGANVMEAQNSESRKDFIHKIKIALKEAEETEYWLVLCDASPKLPDPSTQLDQLLEIQKVLSKIAKTTITTS